MISFIPIFLTSSLITPTTAFYIETTSIYHSPGYFLCLHISVSCSLCLKCSTPTSTQPQLLFMGSQPRHSTEDKNSLSLALHYIICLTHNSCFRKFRQILELKKVFLTYHPLSLVQEGRNRQKEFRRNTMEIRSESQISL